MGSDNYMLIRKVDERYGVTMEFASEDEVRDFGRRARWFSTLDAAVRFASRKRTEYGITFEGMGE